MLAVFSHVFSLRPLRRFFDSARLDIWCLWNFLSAVNISLNVSRQLAGVKRLCSGWSLERSVWSRIEATFDYVVARTGWQAEPAYRSATNIIRTQHSWDDSQYVISWCWVFPTYASCHLNISAPAIRQWFSVWIIILARWRLKMFVYACVRIWTCLINMLRLLIHGTFSETGKLEVYFFLLQLINPPPSFFSKKSWFCYELKQYRQ